jgi:hypothetical protein
MVKDQKAFTEGAALEAERVLAVCSVERLAFVIFLVDRVKGFLLRGTEADLRSSRPFDVVVLQEHACRTGRLSP